MNHNMIQGKNSKHVQLTKNLILNLISYGLPVFLLQFIIQPIVAFNLGSELNGLFLTLLGINYFLTTITASTLSKTRLLQNKKYVEGDLNGDFNIYLIIMAFVNSILFVSISFFYTQNINVYDVLLSVLLVLLFLYHDYVVVQYKINLNFKKILVNNIILSIGYFIGLYVFLLTNFWQIVFVIPYILSSIYDFFNTSLIKEPLIKTRLFKETTKIFLILSVSSILTSLISYIDRLLLYPILGGTELSIFHSASIIGKMLVILSIPVSNVLLSYIVNEKKFSLKFKSKYYIFFLGFLIIAYFGVIIIGPYILKLLYPLWYQESIRYLPITTLTGLIIILSTLINVYLVRFYHSKYQLFVNVIYLIVYLSISTILLIYFGLMGFAIGNLISAIVRLTLVSWIIFFSKNRVVSNQEINEGSN